MSPMKRNLLSVGIIAFLICSLVLLTPPLPTQAAATFVNQVAAGGTTNSVTTGAGDMAGANGSGGLLMQCVSYSSSGTLSSVTDDSSNVYTALTAECGVGGQCINIYYKASPVADSSMTFTVSGTSIFPSVVAMGFSGMHATPMDQEAAGGSVEGTTVQPGSITPSEANELLLTCAAFNAGVYTINSPYVNSVYQIAFLGGNHYGVAGTYFIQGAAAAVNPTWTSDTSAHIAAHQASFKAAASATSAVPIFHRRRN